MTWLRPPDRYDGVHRVVMMITFAMQYRLNPAVQSSSALLVCIVSFYLLLYESVMLDAGIHQN